MYGESSFSIIFSLISQIVVWHVTFIFQVLFRSNIKSLGNPGDLKLSFIQEDILNIIDTRWCRHEEERSQVVPKHRLKKRVRCRHTSCSSHCRGTDCATEQYKSKPRRPFDLNKCCSKIWEERREEASWRQHVISCNFLSVSMYTNINYTWQTVRWL